MSELENQDAKANEDVQPIVAPQALEQAADQPAALTRDQENVIFNLQVLESGDHKILAQVLADNPAMREQIIARAAADLGNDTVAKALSILAGVPEPEAPSEKAAASSEGEPAAEQTGFDYTTSPLALEYDEAAKIRDHVDFMRANPAVADQVVAQTAELDVALATEVLLQFDKAPAQAEPEAQKEETPPQVVEETSRQAVEETRPAGPAVERAAPVSVEEAVEVKPAPEPEKESGWAVRAREFNAEHADEVAVFLAATGGACMVDGMLDPNLVAQWQSRHGVEVDGRVGAGTVEAAIKNQPQTFEEAAKEAEEEQTPEPDPTDPRYAL